VKKWKGVLSGLVACGVIYGLYQFQQYRLNSQREAAIEASRPTEMQVMKEQYETFRMYPKDNIGKLVEWKLKVVGGSYGGVYAKLFSTDEINGVAVPVVGVDYAVELYSEKPLQVLENDIVTVKGKFAGLATDSGDVHLDVLEYQKIGVSM
jgi:hypothetical protein